MDTKKCYKCKQDKPLSDFSKDPYGKYYLSSKCKMCARSTFAEYYKKYKKYHDTYCNEIICCDDCLCDFKRNGKTSHYKTKKHLKKTEEYNKLTLI